VRLRAYYRRSNKPNKDGELPEKELVVIIHIEYSDPEFSPQAVFVRENGTMGDDYIQRFTVIDGAW